MDSHGKPVGHVVTSHFDAVAPDYDFWKKKNPYYYSRLYSIARAHAGGARHLLDVGCGTGAMIRAVKPLRATGLDISPGMVRIARENNRENPEHEFVVADVTLFEAKESYDAILFFDVIEHVEDIDVAIRAMHRLLAPGGRLIITMANPLWEPILMLAERRGLKMPEGPHHRIWGGELLQIAKDAGLVLTKREWHLLFPKDIPWFSWFVNDVVGKLPLLRRLSVIEVFVFTRS